MYRDDSQSTSVGMTCVLDLHQAGGVICRYQFGGLITPVKEVKVKEYKSLEDSLVRTTAPRASDSATRYPQMLDTEAAYRGDGIDVHLAFAAVLDFQEKEGRWPRMRSKDDADAMLKIATGISDARKEMDSAIWAQTYTEPDWMETFDNQWGVPRDVNARTVGRFSRLFSTELTGFCAYLGGAIAQEVISRPQPALPSPPIPSPPHPIPAVCMDGNLGDQEDRQVHTDRPVDPS